MADFNDIKGAVLNTLGTVAEKTRDIAEKAADKAKDMTKIAKLQLELSSVKDSIQKAYGEIGKIYYDTHKNNPDDFYVQLCQEITVSLENVERLQQEISNVKTGACGCEPDIEVEVTQTPAAGEEDFVKEESASETKEEPVAEEKDGGCSCGCQ